MILSPRQAQTINTGYLFRNQNVNKFKFWPAIGADWLTNVNYLSWSIGKWASFRHNAAVCNNYVAVQFVFYLFKIVSHFLDSYSNFDFVLFF